MAAVGYTLALAGAGAGIHVCGTGPWVQGQQ